MQWPQAICQRASTIISTGDFSKIAIAIKATISNMRRVAVPRHRLSRFARNCAGGPWIVGGVENSSYPSVIGSSEKL
jgi:hypothetical protein